MYSWISLIPTALVLLLAIITQNINKALTGGIICAALIVHKTNIFGALASITSRLHIHLTDGDNIALYLFLIITSSLITLFSKTGTIYAVAQKVSNKLKTKRSAEYTSFFSSLLLSIDDYLSILTIGFMMRPLSVQLAIAPSRLAFFVHSLAGPLVVLSPLSSWVAAILLQMDQAGVHPSLQATTAIISDPFFLYLQVIPFLFYPLLTIATVVYVIQTQTKFETEPKNIHDNSAQQTDIEKNNYSIFDIIAPIITLLVTVVIGLLYSGGYKLFDKETSLLQAIQKNDATFIVMFIGATVAFCLAYAISLYKKHIHIKNLGSILGGGVMLIKGAVIMVILSSIFSVFVRDDLHTGAYLAHLFLDSLSDIFLPLMIFVTAVTITLTTGSAWGTFALLLPIVTQMLITLQSIPTPTTPESIYLLLPCLGAIFSGAVCGDHLSPFSETTIMTATATGITPLQHAKTQLVYMIPALITTMLLFLLTGVSANIPLLQNPLVLPLLGIIGIIILLQLEQKIIRK